MKINLQLNKTQLKICEKLIEANIFKDLRINETFKSINKFGIGKIYDNKISFSNKDILIIRENVSNLNVLTRGEAQLNSGNEKSSINKRVHKNEVLLRATRSLKINNREMEIFGGALLINSELIYSIQHEMVIVIENYETFLNFNDSKDFLIIYRGEKQFNLANVYSFLNRLKIPVWVYPDYDFSGLIIAKSYPYFKDIYIRNISNIETLFGTYGNNTIFIKQNRFVNYIDNKPNFNFILSMINKHQKILLQEGIEIIEKNFD